MAKKTTKKIYTQKTISYTMPGEVVESLEIIMSKFGMKTMTKALNFCVLEYQSTRSALDTEHEAKSKLYHKCWKLEESINTFTKALEDLQKHTKNS